jgi:6-phosphogluconolactonase
MSKRNAHNAGPRRGAYELAPRPRTPTLPGDVVLRRSLEETIDALLADLLMHAMSCARSFGDFHLALSADEELTPLYVSLMIDPRWRELPWKRTHLWMVADDRVALDDPRSGFRRLRELLVEHSDIPPAQVHPFITSRADADRLYEQELREALAWREKGHDRLDFALLHLAAEGRAPAPPAPDAAEQRLVALDAPPAEQGPGRIGLTTDFLNATRFLAILAAGDDRRAAVAEVETDAQRERAVLPVGALRPMAGALRWYLDFDACPDEA